ncbi:MAG: carbohydrate ABC transporter permease, partial [Candidatus Rokuibacteriota bacterium]
MTAAARRRRRTWLLGLAGLLVAVFFLAPFSWLVLTSFMHESDAMSVPLRLLRARPTLENYATFVAPSGTRSIVGSRAAENTMPGIWNSMLAATGTAVLNLVLGILAGYSFARLRFPGRTSVLFLYLGSRMVPGIALIVPLYLVIQRAGLLDTLLALVVTYLTFTLPFTIWLLKSYFQGIPRELEEAALVDGCGFWRMMGRVLLPAAAPGLVAAAMFAFMTAW